MIGLSVALVAIFLTGAGRLFELQVIEGSDNREMSDHNRFRKEVLRARRGHILDRQGRVLVDNFASFVVTINPHAPELRGGDRLAEMIGRVAAIVDRDSAEIFDGVASARRRSYLPVRVAQNIPEKAVARVAEALAELPGVDLRVEPLRRYPHGKLAAHLLGYVGEISPDEYRDRAEEGYEPDDQVGKTAIEEAFDRALHGRNGVSYVEVDAFGRARNFSSVRTPTPAVPGEDLVLTIDLDLQRALENALDATDSVAVVAPRRGAPIVGAGVALDVHTGAILAMASRPTFDPNQFAAGLGRASWTALSTDAEKPLLNRVLKGRYPPGSTFKMLIAIAALDSGLVRASTELSPCWGSFRYGNRSFGCWKRSGHGTLSLSGALAQSCDVYFYQLGDMLGVDGIARYANAFGVARRTGIDIRGEERGLVPDAAYLTDRYGSRGWSRGAALNMAIGQGEFLMTPLALASHVATIANDGRLVRPHLVERPGVGRPGSEPPPEIARHLAGWLGQVRGMMRRVVTDTNGTARTLRIDGLAVAGKTGTSQNPHGEDHALFVSFAPADEPEVALVVILERRGHGGAVAAPVAAEFWKRYRDWRDAHLAGDVDGTVG